MLNLFNTMLEEKVIGRMSNLKFIFGALPIFLLDYSKSQEINIFWSEIEKEDEEIRHSIYS